VRRRPVGGVAGLVVLGLAVLGALPVGAAAPAAAAADGVDRPVRDRRIVESSGLAVGTRRAPLLWTMNDSGGGPVLFGLDRRGAVAAAVTVRGVRNQDWEALAAWRDGAGRSLLAVGDVGDNRGRRPSVTVHVLAEPAARGAASARPLRSIALRYPDGPQDAETLLADPRTDRLYVVTKGLFSSTVYAVPAAAWPGARGAGRSPALLQRIREVPIVLCTDGVIAPDGHVLLRSYGSVFLFPPLGPGGPDRPGSSGAAPSVEPLTSAALPDQPQGEGMALAADGRSVLLSSEGRSEPILRSVLTDRFLARADGGLLVTTRPAPGAPAAPAPGAPSGAPSGAAVATAAPSGGATGEAPAVPVAAVAVFVLAGLAAAAFTLARRR